MEPNMERKVHLSAFDLTKREVEVLHFLAKGCTCKQISERLFISYETAKRHIKNLYKKLNAKNKVDALRKSGLF